MKLQKPWEKTEKSECGLLSSEIQSEGTVSGQIRDILEQTKVGE